VIQLALDRDALLDLMQDSWESLALNLGILVASSLLEDEVTRLCGRRCERQPHRTHTRYGHQPGTATLAGQKIAIVRPRVRPADGGGEVPLETGAQALHAAAKRVWGQNGVIQRCQVHKKRNVKAHVPEKHHAELERRLSEAYHETGYDAAKASLEATARWLERINPDAASSLREGLEGVRGGVRETLNQRIDVLKGGFLSEPRSWLNQRQK
jgi:Transposase, Mutator family